MDEKQAQEFYDALEGEIAKIRDRYKNVEVPFVETVANATFWLKVVQMYYPDSAEFIAALMARMQVPGVTVDASRAGETVH